MRTTIFLAIAIFSLHPGAYAQLSSIVAAEYFFDTDPGIGAATPLPSFVASQNLEVNFLAASSGLSKGMHMLGLRVRDSNNLWSIPAFMPVYILANDPLTVESITGAEYFFDVDPGVGNATAISVGSPAPIIVVDFAAASSGLSTGVHMLAVRSRNVNGEWGIASFTPLYIDRNRTITKLEYFFNTDPGVGNAEQLPVSPATDVLDLIFTANSSALGPATHTLNVRVAGQNDFWGIAETVSFVICSAATASFSADVVCVGSATSFTDNSTTLSGDVYAWDFETDGTIDDNTAGNTTFIYPAAGTYTATLTINRSGCISSTLVTVTVDDVASVTAGPDQTICETGTAALISTVGGTATMGLWSTAGDGLFDDTSLLNALYTPGASDISNGNVTLIFTSEDPSGACGPVAATTIITIDEKATVNAGTDANICIGTSVNLSGSRGGSAASSTWTTAGDGTFDNATSLTATYSPGANDITTGNVALTLTSDDPSGLCNAASDVVAVALSANTTVDAGPDQTFCSNDAITLAGTVGGPTTTYNWSTAGDGTFSYATILNPEYSPGSNDLTTGSVVLTLTTDPVGACLSQNDQSTIFLTKDINIVGQTSSATIANVVSVQVTAGGTFNTGDVLITTILTIPKKGTAQVKTGNVVEYTANNGTVGADSVEIQVCNQCDQCNREFFYFNIQNAPPVIDVPPASTPAGGRVVIPISSSISDPNGNLDLSTVIVLDQPSSGAFAEIDANNNLIIDYEGIDFSGTDNLTIQACDDLGACSDYVITIEVGNISTDIQIYNAIAPNSTGDNRHMRILNLPNGNKVSIYNRWGDKVFEIENYDSNTPGKRFEGDNEDGKKLPSGTYFYKIQIPDRDLLTGYLSLKQ
ncbi:MAG: gliding motility-associated C-terminal domain-containing protein [Cyclobacteriaceae bacterium]